MEPYSTIIIVVYLCSVVFNAMFFFFTTVISATEEHFKNKVWVDTFFIALAVVPIVNTIACIVEAFIIFLALFGEDEDDEDDDDWEVDNDELQFTG